MDLKNLIISLISDESNTSSPVRGNEEGQKHTDSGGVSVKLFEVILVQIIWNWCPIATDLFNYIINEQVKLLLPFKNSLLLITENV